MNTHTIIGRISKDATVGTTMKGKPYARFTLIWDESRKKADPPETAKPNILFCETYGNEAIYDYLTQGKIVAVTGRMQIGSYKKEDGTTEYTKSLIADRIKLIPDGAMYGMSSSVIVGNLCGDAKVRYIPGTETAVTEFRVAVNRSWDPEHPDVFPVKMIGKRGESLSRFLVKGKLVAVKGRIRTDSYKRKDGTTAFTWCIIPSSDPDGIDLMGKSRKDKDASTAPANKPAPAAQSPAPPAPQEAPEAPVAAPAEATSDTSEFEDLGFTELPDEFDDDYRFDF